MRSEQLYQLLENPDLAEPLLTPWGIIDTRRAHGNLVSMAAAGITLDLLATLCQRLAEYLPKTSDPEMALNNLDRFVAASRNPLSLGSLFERDPESLGVLLQILSTSQHLSDVLVRDPEGYDLLRMTEGQPVNREMLIAEVATEVAALSDEAAAMNALRRFKRRETLRIAYGDIIRGQRLQTVTAQISHLADALVEAAIRFARRRLEEKRGTPRRPDGEPARFVALAMGKLGGVELNYSSDIDLVFLYDADGKTDGARQATNLEFFERLARDVVRLLTEPTDLGYTYRVDLRLRPEGQRGAVVHSLERAVQYYDVLGRTWERQAYVKARAIAGDISLGREFLTHLEPWIYRRYLGLADITGIKALKRRIEQRVLHEGDNERNVKTGHGGIRDIEFVIQFLQLLNAGDLPALRTGTTLTAIAELENCGCLTHQERLLLEENYSFLRKIEHRLQILFDLQTHLLPEKTNELRKLALRMGYADTRERTALVAFEADYQTKTALNRKILDHLLHDAFGDDARAEPEVDLVLDPDPPAERIEMVLGRYGFRDVPLAYKNLMALATEKIRFLSTRRCRHFLASIAPGLLKAIAATPDPDSTLVNLENVSDSLGGKGVLWELFSFNPPSLDLYVELCASSPLLSGILISNPGMLDELMDSLVLNRLPTIDELRETLAELTRGAEDIDPILHSFKNAQELRVGVRDILGKEDVQSTMAALSDIAETCLECIARVEYEKLVLKLGEPTIGPTVAAADETSPGDVLPGDISPRDTATVEEPAVAVDRAGEPCKMIIVALGKFGGRELNYRSDLDIIFLYEADGQTVHGKRTRRGEVTNNQHFFGELAQRIIKVMSRLGPNGRLYEVDPRLRPTGKSGTLAMPLVEFSKYFAEGHAQLWERQALTKGRVIDSTPQLAEQTTAILRAAAYDSDWQAGDAATIREMRKKLEASTSATSLKRGPGGIVDVEFLVQMLQLKYGRSDASLRVTNTHQAIAALHDAGRLNSEDYEFFTASQRFLQIIKSRLRLLNASSRNELPDDPMELIKLARGMGYADGEELRAACERFTRRNRERLEAIFAKA